MKSRADIKAVAKQRLSNEYWPLVGTFFIVSLLTVAIGASIFFVGPLYAGMAAYSAKKYRGENEPFKLEITGRQIGGGAWQTLFTLLWSMLFVIPGIIKGYSYALNFYILGMYKNVKAKSALKLSMRIMKGHKWELFVFQLSYIGWFLLTLITFGLVEIFYVSPYYEIAVNGYYDELVKNALATGVVSQDELDGKVDVA